MYETPSSRYLFTLQNNNIFRTRCAVFSEWHRPFIHRRTFLINQTWNSKNSRIVIVTVLLFLAYENRTQKEVCLFKKYLRSNYTRELCPFSERLKGTKSKWPAVLIRAGHSEYVRALDGQETYDNDSSNYNIIWGLERMRTDRGAWVRMRGKNWDRDV